MVIPGAGAPPLQAVIATMLQGVAAELVGLAPPPVITLLGAEERPVGLANLVGTEPRGPLPQVSVKGGRLAAGLRFEVRGGDLPQTDTAIFTLHGRLLGARKRLLARGFLRLDGGEFSPPEPEPGGGGFRRSASYRVLFEYRYRDVDGAASLITRIPVHRDLGERGADRETSVVTGGTVRWDEEQAPVLMVRGPWAVARLSMLAFLPAGPPGVAVVVRRSFTGAAGAPPPVAALTDLAAAAHAEVTFPALSDLLAILPPTGDAVELGDWDADLTPDLYEIRSLALVPPIVLTRSIDRLEIVTATDAGWTGNKAVVYLRVEGA